MSIPIAQLVFAGVWSVSGYYPQFQYVLSPIDNNCYVNVGITPSVGGSDPSVQPSSVWVLMNASTVFPSAYASYSSTQTQPMTANTVLPIIYDTEDVPPILISCPIPDSEISVANAGLYKVLTSVQLNRTNAGNSTIVVFPRIDGVAVANSASKININQQEEDIITIEWFLSLGGKPLQICVFSTDNNDECLAVSADIPNGIPAVPSIITTILRIA